MSPQAVLVIEDDAAIRRGIVDALRHAGYRIFKAARGDVGRELALSRSYDLLLLDLVLPGGDGLDLLRAVRAGAPHASSDHPHRSRRRAGSGRGASPGCRRLRRQAVQRQGTLGAGRSRAAAHAGAASRRRGSSCREWWPIWPAAKCDFPTARFQLADKEAEVLRYLAANAGRAISREELLRRVWQLDPRRIVDPHDRRARRPAARETARRSERSPHRADRARQRLYVCRAGRAHRSSGLCLNREPPMRRAWQIWTAFAALLAATALAVGWLSVSALEAERDQIAASRRADLEERVRLALWRMDSFVAPLLARRGPAAAELSFVAARHPIHSPRGQRDRRAAQRPGRAAVRTAAARRSHALSDRYAGTRQLAAIAPLHRILALGGRGRRNRSLSCIFGSHGKTGRRSPSAGRTAAGRAGGGFDCFVPRSSRPTTSELERPTRSQ